MRTVSPVALGVLLVIGMVARIVVLPRPGTEDMLSWKAAALGASADLTGVYGLHGEVPDHPLASMGGDFPPQYPVVAVAEFAAAGWLYRAIHPAPTDSRLLSAIVKLPGLAAEMAFVATILIWGARDWARRSATWIALAYWLNPAIWLPGAMLGYADAQMAVPAVCALVAAAGGRSAIAGVLLAVAMLTKPQAVFVVPALVLVIRARPRPFAAMSRLAIAAVLTGAAALAPFLVRGAWTNLVHVAEHFFGHNMLSGTAANVWWIASWMARTVYHAPEAGWRAAARFPVFVVKISRWTRSGYPDPRLVGWAIVTALWCWAGWRMRRGLSLAASMSFAAWTVYAYAMFAPNVHENHLYLALVCLVIAAGLDRRARPVFCATCAISALNLYLCYGFGQDMPPVIDEHWTFIDPSVWLAIASLGVFVWFTARQFRGWKAASPAG